MADISANEGYNGFDSAGSSSSSSEFPKIGYVAADVRRPVMYPQSSRVGYNWSFSPQDDEAWSSENYGFNIAFGPRNLPTETQTISAVCPVFVEEGTLMTLTYRISVSASGGGVSSAVKLDGEPLCRLNVDDEEAEYSPVEQSEMHAVDIDAGYHAIAITAAATAEDPVTGVEFEIISCQSAVLK